MAKSRQPKRPVASGTVRRPRGRPAAHDLPAGQSGLLSRELILKRAVDLSRTVRLEDLSIVRLSKELEVTRAAIHYHFDSREVLTSSIINQVYKKTYAKVLTAEGDWREKAEYIAHVTYDTFVEYAGVCDYLVSNLQFRIFQSEKIQEENYSILFLNHVLRALHTAKFSPENIAEIWNLLFPFIASSAHHEIAHMNPREHKAYLERRFAELPAESVSDILPVLPYLTQLGGKETFQSGLAILLDGLEAKLKRQRTVKKRK